MTRYRETGNVKDHAKSGRPRKTTQQTDNLISGMAAILFLQQMGPNAVYQHDNARPHTARIVTDNFQQNNVNVQEWPACSLDLSPIEHLWDQLGRAVHAGLTPNHNLSHLRQFMGKNGQGNREAAEYHNISQKQEE